MNKRVENVETYFGMDKPLRLLKIIQGLFICETPKELIQRRKKIQICIVHLKKDCFGIENEGYYGIVAGHTLKKHEKNEIKLKVDPKKEGKIIFLNKENNIILSNFKIFISKSKKDDIGLIYIPDNLINDEMKKVINEFQIVKKKCCLAEKLKGVAFQMKEEEIIPSLVEGKVSSEASSNYPFFKMNTPTTFGYSGTVVIDNQKQICGIVAGSTFQFGKEKDEFVTFEEVKQMINYNNLKKDKKALTSLYSSRFFDIGMFKNSGKKLSIY